MRIAKIIPACPLAVLIALSAAARPASAQESAAFDWMGHSSKVAETDLGLQRGSFIVAPVPFSNPTIDNGLLLGAGYLFNLPGSKPSGVGFGKLKSGNGSNGAAIGASVTFAEGLWTIFGFGGTAEVFYDLALNDVNLPIRQDGELYALRVERGLTQRFKIGAMVSYLDSSIAIDSPVFEELPDFLKPQGQLELGQITLDAVWDTRDDTFFPTTGALVSANVSYAHEIDSILDGAIELDKVNYAKLTLSAAKYNELDGRGVFAYHGQICTSSENAPFFDSCGIGMASGLRGFPSTEFINDASASLQGEYRGQFNHRFGYAAFAAVGAGGNDLGSLSFKEGGASAGFGLRYRLSKKFQLDYRLDFARNNRGDDFFYISLGQKF